MRLYFLRHGIAVPRTGWTGDDGLRPLTSEGVWVMHREAIALVGLGLAPGAMVTSPLLRARRTAEIVAEALGLADRLIDDARLAHGCNACAVAEVLASLGSVDEVMLIGHEPEFGATISEIIGGAAVTLEKGGLARVDISAAERRTGALVWLLTPALLQRL